VKSSSLFLASAAAVLVLYFVRGAPRDGTARGHAGILLLSSNYTTPPVCAATHIGVVPECPAVPSACPTATLHPSPSPVEDSTWARRVRYRHFDGHSEDYVGHCDIAQVGIRPVPSPDQFSSCPAPEFATVESSGWSSLTDRLLAVPCTFRGSLVQKRHYFNIPSENASVYIVYAQAGPQGETPAARSTRQGLTRWTLQRLRSQFGDSVEITVVDLFEDVIDENASFGRGVVNTVIASTQAEGQDWGMYQEGLHAAWHRLGAFEWVIVMNDLMVGPVGSFPSILRNAAAGADMYITSSWPGCCVRGFFVGFRRPLVATEAWQNYWQRIHFPCQKIGPMFQGEGALARPPLLWKNCVASTTHPVSSNDDLAKLLAVKTPFLYRKGLVRGFPIPGMPDSVADVPAMVTFLETLSVPTTVTSCDLRRRRLNCGTVVNGSVIDLGE